MWSVVKWILVLVAVAAIVKDPQGARETVAAIVNAVGRAATVITGH